MIENETATSSESGSVTILAPGFNLISEGPDYDLVIDYRYNALFYHGIDQDDNQVQELKLESEYRHIPDKWTSTLDASSRQVNTDVNGVRNVDLEFADIGSEELDTVVAETRVTDDLSSTIDYRTNLYADYARIEDDEPTTGYGGLVGLDNLRSSKDFLWDTSIETQVSEDEDSSVQIDELDLNLNYRLTRKWATFVDYAHTEVDRSDFEEDFVLAGMIWRPSTRTYLKAGAGDREGENAYTLDARHERRDFSLSATYDEDITSLREDTLDQQSADISAQSTAESISIDPVLQKRTTVNFSILGKYSEINTTLYRIDRSRGDTVEDEITDGLRIFYGRNLSAKNFFSVDLLYEESVTDEENELTDISLDLTRQHSRDERIILSLKWTEQVSTIEVNEYERTILSAEYIVAF